MTNPPCYDKATRTDCPKRHVGCKTDCPEWEKWLAIHESENRRIMEAKSVGQAADGFLVERKKRTRQDSLRRSERKNRRRKA